MSAWERWDLEPMDLKNCPFCNGVPTTITTTIKPWYKDFYKITCKQCRIEMHGDYNDGVYKNEEEWKRCLIDMVTRWNKRI